MRRSTPEDFWARVQIGGPDECWPFLGALRKDGYGSICYQGRRGALAHRLAYELKHGPVPEGLCVLHHCDNPPCCNDAHLWIGTRGDNNADRDAKGRRQPPRGELHGRAKLTAVQVMEIRAKYAAGARQIPLATEYGVGKSLISLIVRREAWAHLR
jgi:Autographiviridae endonuclease